MTTSFIFPLLFLFIFSINCQPLQPVRISVLRKNPQFTPKINVIFPTSPTSPKDDEKLENTVMEEEKYDPFDLAADDLTSLTDNSTRIKLELETQKYIEKFGAQQFLDIILEKLKKIPILHPEAKNNLGDFLNFVENLIYNKAAKRIEDRLKLDFSKIPNNFVKLHSGEAKVSKKPTMKMHKFDESNFRRDDPNFAQDDTGLLTNPQPDPIAIVRQPTIPTRLAFLTQNDANVLRAEKTVRKSPIRKSHKKRKFAKAVKRRASARTSKRKLPIEKLRRSPIPGSKVSFNEKMFQLLDDYGIDTFYIQTADYTVRAVADPHRTRFRAATASVNSIESEIRRSPVIRRPPFIYSRTVENPKRRVSRRYATALKRIL